MHSLPPLHGTTNAGMSLDKQYRVVTECRLTALCGALHQQIQAGFGPVWLHQQGAVAVAAVVAVSRAACNLCLGAGHRGGAWSVSALHTLSLVRLGLFLLFLGF